MQISYRFFRTVRLLFTLAAVSTGVAACNRSSLEAPGKVASRKCIEDFDAQKDYFPDKTYLEYAQNFSVEYHNSYKVVTVRRPTDHSPDERYILLQCGAPMPVRTGGLEGAQLVTIPIESMFSSSLTHLPLLVDLGHVEVLSGVDQKRFVTTAAVVDWIRQGHVTEYAPNNVTDVELVISKSPTIFMASNGDPAGYAAIQKAGIGVVNNSDWQETSALGRAEWVKYMALYLNEEAKAARLFGGIRDRYMALRQRTQSIPDKDRPRVMTGLANRGAFEIAGGRSYVAKMIEDAGGHYVWADNESSGFAIVDIESEIARASGADIWINGADWKSRKAMLAEEARYKHFKAYRNGAVWLYNRLVNENGGNDYWARGSTRPDLILGDLIKIFHPDLAKDHEFVWYKQVPAE